MYANYATRERILIILWLNEFYRWVNNSSMRVSCSGESENSNSIPFVDFFCALHLLSWKNVNFKLEICIDDKIFQRLIVQLVKKLRKPLKIFFLHFNPEKFFNYFAEKISLNFISFSSSQCFPFLISSPLEIMRRSKNSSLYPRRKLFLLS